MTRPQRTRSQPCPQTTNSAHSASPEGMMGEKTPFRSGGGDFHLTLTLPRHLWTDFLFEERNETEKSADTKHFS